MKSFKTFLSEKSKAPQMKDGYKGKEQVADIKQLLGGIGNQHQNGQIKSALKKAEKAIDNLESTIKVHGSNL